MQHLQMQHAVHMGVHGEFGTAGDHLGARGRPDAGADDVPRTCLFDRGDAVDGILDRAVSGAAAQVSLQRARQVLLLLRGERRRGHDHAGGAEAALKTGGVAELSLKRMEVVRGAEVLDRGDLAAVGAERRRDAAVHRFSVEPNGAGAAIARVATLFDAELPELAHEGAQALSGTRLLAELPAVHGVGHDWPPSSVRICSAKCFARWRRWSGVPFGSSNHTSSGSRSIVCCSVSASGMRSNSKRTGRVVPAVIVNIMSSLSGVCVAIMKMVERPRG